MTPTFYWGFTAQQAVEKLLKVLIVLRDQRPPRSHELSELAALAEVNYQLNCLVYKPMQQFKLSVNTMSSLPEKWHLLAPLKNIGNIINKKRKQELAAVPFLPHIQPRC